MQRTFRLNNTAATFPLVSTFFGRSTLTRAPEDSNYIITNAYSGAQADRDIGIPMPLYMHNVMPTTQGLTSVGYKQVAPPTEGAFHEATILRTSEDSRFIFCGSSGRLLDRSTNEWKSAGAPIAGLTKAYLHKKTYLCNPGVGLLAFSEQSGSMYYVSLQGIDTRMLLGVTQANNYLVAYTKDTIYWSHVLNAEDMLPSLETTAGSEIPLAIRGQIVCCLPTQDGFNIYTTANMVAAKYSNNVRFPFVFTEIAGSGGVTEPRHVTSDSNSDTQFAWTTQGLQAIGGKDAKAVFPEITDFLTGHLFEEYIGPTGMVGYSNISQQWSSESQSWGDWPIGENNLRQFYWNGELKKRLTLIANRWLVVSYGFANFGWALVYDQALKRWGKLRIAHTDCFELSTTRGQVVDQEANHQLAFLQQDGRVLVANFEQRTIAEDSVLIFGRLQHTRGKVLTIHSFEVENGRPGKMDLTLLTSLDGKNWLPDKQAITQIATENLTKWLVRTTGINHCFKLVGTFDIVTLQGSCTVGGGR